MKKGLPLGALRTSQAAGREPESCVASVLGGCCEGESPGDMGGAWLWGTPAPLCAAAAAGGAVAATAGATTAGASVVFCPTINRILRWYGEMCLKNC